MAFEDPLDCDFDALWSQFQDGYEEGNGKDDATFSAEPFEHSSSLDEPQNGNASLSSLSQHFLIEVPEDNDDNATQLKPPEPTPQSSPSVSFTESYPEEEKEERAKSNSAPREVLHHHFANPPHFFHHHSDMAHIAHHPSIIYLPHLNGYAVPVPVQHLPNNMLVTHWPNFNGDMAIQHGGDHSSPVMSGLAPPLMAAHSHDDPAVADERPPREKKSRLARRVLKRKAPKPEPEAIVLPDGFDRVLLKAAAQDEPDFSPGGNWKPPPRRDIRKCETKVMLQTSDGQVFNKYFEEEDIRDFARRFKILRCEYGFSQADVGAALGRRFGSEFSQTTISRFEGLVLSHSNMCKLRPPVEQWLADIQLALENGVPVEHLRRASKTGEFWPTFEPENEESQALNLAPPLRKRRKRTSLEPSQILALDSYFELNDRPDNIQMYEISQTLDLEFDVVRVWFCNRRQKSRKEIPKVIKTEIVEDSETTSSPIN